MRRVISLLSVYRYSTTSRFGIDLDVGILFQRAAARCGSSGTGYRPHVSQRQVLEPCRVEVAFSKTLHILFPRRRSMSIWESRPDRGQGGRGAERRARQSRENRASRRDELFGHHGRRMLLLFHGGLFRKSFRLNIEMED